MAGERHSRSVLVLIAVVLAGLALFIAWRKAAPPAPPEAAPGAASTSASATPLRRTRALRSRGAQQIDLSGAERVPQPGVGRIEGSVLSRADSTPLAGARLVFDDGTLHTVVADANGAFVFTPPKEGTYELALVRANGFLPFAPEYGHSPMVFTARVGSGLAGARVYLTPAVAYRVHVVSPGATPQPVVGARVVVLGGAAAGTTLDDGPPSWTTNENGTAVVVGLDHAVFEASHPDYAPGRGRLDFSGQVSGEITIQLRRPDDIALHTGRLSGTVSAEGAPLPGALVVARYEAENPARTRAALMPSLRTTTDEHGRFSFEEMLRGGYRLSASAPDYAPTGVMAVAPSRGVVLELKRGASLLGDVTDDQGAPVPAFVVVVREQLGPLRKEVVVAEPTFDPEGHYAIPALARGSYLVTVSAHGFAPTDERTVAIDKTDVREDFVLERGATLRGIVLDADTQEPLVGAKVSLEGEFGGVRAVQLSAASRTDEAGRFTLPGVARGTQSLLAVAAEHHGKLVRLDVTSPNPPEQTVELTPTAQGEEPRIELAGIGAVLSAKGDVLLIGGVVDGGGALEAGLAPDDAIVAIDGIPVAELGFAGSINAIRGPVGSSVVLTVRKAGTDGVRNIEVVRRKIRG